MMAHEIEGRCEKTSYIIRVSGIRDAADVSVSLAYVEVVRGIIRVSGWIGITLVIQHVYTCAEIAGGVCVPFDAEATRGVAEVPSLVVGLL